MERKREVELVCKGLTYEIRQIQKSIRKGEKLLSEKNQGIEIKSPLSKEEIIEKLKKLHSRVEELENERFFYSYDSSILTLEQLKNVIKNNNGKLNDVIDSINSSTNINQEGKQHIVYLFGKIDIEVRICSICNKLIIEGYGLCNEEYYACDSDCCSQILTDEEFDESYEHYQSYWSKWTVLDKRGLPYIGYNFKF
ncbi:MAG: hypothetical protein E7E64_05185 [Clostridium celatum]|uniref:hypothetical protein n=1 Tax=Clostridium tertium TaxID=1559 RepID=UPI0029027FC7|nr:hypothetical protein [Clostridium celatum]